MHTEQTVPRLALIVAVFIIAVGMATGCGQDTPDTAKKTSSENRLPLHGKRVTFLISLTQTRAAEALATWFKAETGATVRVIEVEYQDLHPTTIRDCQSELPQIDVMMIWYPHLGKLAADGIIQPLDDFYKRHAQTLQADDFIADMFHGYTWYDGHRWAIPFDGDTHLLFYRKSIFAKYNLEPPATWSQYGDAARLITQKEKTNGIYGAAMMAYPVPIIIVSTFMNRLGGFGGALMDKEMRPQVNSPEAVAALSAMVAHSKHALPTPLETDFAVSRDAFLQGHVAMVEQWSDIGIMAEDDRQSFIQGDWGVVPMPKGSGQKAQQASALNAGFTLGLSRNAPHPEVAETFLAFAARPDIGLKLNLIPGGSGIDPTRKTIIQSKAFKTFAPVLSRAEEAVLGGKMIVWPNHPAMPELLKTLSDSLVAALEERQSPQAALDACQKKWDAIVNKDNS